MVAWRGVGIDRWWAGRGVVVDQREAARLFKLAADHGDAEAKELLAEVMNKILGKN